ncbi:MAG: hypothetical protein EZS28_050430, partial [Streblomastix strix]
MTELIANNIEKKEDVENNLPFELVMECIDLVKRTPTKQITRNLIDPILRFSYWGSSEHTQVMFEMGLIQTLTPALQTDNEDLQRIILIIFINIVKNGWKQEQSNYPQSQSQIQDMPSKGQSQSQSDHNKLNYILSLPNPYLAELEKQGTINQIIESVLMTEAINLENEEQVYFLLNALYPDGIQLPSEYKDDIIQQLCIECNSEDDDEENQYGLQSISYLAVNQ